MAASAAFGSNTFASVKPGDRRVIDRFAALPMQKRQKHRSNGGSPAGKAVERPPEERIHDV